jgi:hypothetical protein
LNPQQRAYCIDGYVVKSSVALSITNFSPLKVFLLAKIQGDRIRGGIIILMTPGVLC